MSENGVRVAEVVRAFKLEVLNKGADYDEVLLTITDVNRPGLQFTGFFDYFDPRRLQVIGKAEVTYLSSKDSASKRKCYDNVLQYDIPALVIARGLECDPECLESAR